MVSLTGPVLLCLATLIISAIDVALIETIDFSKSKIHIATRMLGPILSILLLMALSRYIEHLHYIQQ